MQVFNPELEALAILQAPRKSPSNAKSSTPLPDRGKPLPASAQLEGLQSSLDEAVAAINQVLESHQPRIRLLSHPEYETPVIRVIDLETDRVIRQIPPEQTLKLAAWWRDHGVLSGDAVGSLIIDEHV